MSTYLNCYEMVSLIRYELNDFSTTKLQGTDTSGPFKNDMIIRAINDAQMFVFDKLFPRKPYLFLTSATIAGVASVYTLPSDFYQLHRFEDSNGVEAKEIPIDSRHEAAQAGSLWKFYRLGKTLVLDKDSITSNYTGWYYKRPRQITMGMSSAGGANSITLATSARAELSYYVGMTIEDITADLTSAISAYTAARVATIVGTAATSQYYGIVSELPEEFHDLIYRRAAMKLKSMPQSAVPVNPPEIKQFDEDMQAALDAYCGRVVSPDLTGEGGTYYNCYKIVADVRRAIGDYSVEKVQGKDLTGPYLNETIIKAINDGQKYLFDRIFIKKPHLFLTSTTIVGVASAYTLPSDCFQIKRFEDSGGLEIQEISVGARHAASETGSKYKYYRKGSALVLDKDSVTDTLTLWYYKRPRNITMGRVQTGGANSMTLAVGARAELSYYLNMTIENVTADFSSTISVYTAARVATVAGTAGVADFYGLVSELPEDFHHLIERKSSLILRSQPPSKIVPAPIDVDLFEKDLQATIDSYCGRIELPVSVPGETSSYQNCFRMVAEVRRAVGDYSVEKLRGEDLTGFFLNETIIKALNDSQKYLFDLIFVRKPHLFLTSTTITGSSSEYTLPSDFFKLRLFETSDHVQIHPIPVTQRHLNDDGGSKYLYYRKGAILRVDKDSLADVNTLWYYKRPRNITMGRVQTGGANSMTLATSARAEASYYLNMTIENVTADFFSTISAYTAARVATIVGTAGVADFYGLVSELPEEFHHLISRKA
ncbi:MAG: hypothetical protein ABIJ57_06300, partial [Pseudomonadota bacterium]